MSEVLKEAEITYANIQPSPEQIDHGEILRELFTASEEVVASCRPKLWTVAEKVAASTVIPDQQQAIATFAGILDWNFFGKPHDALPTGLVSATSGDKMPILAFDFRIPYINHQLDVLLHRMTDLGLKDALTPFYEEMELRRPAIEAVIEDFIRCSDEFKLLAAFDQPQQKPEAIPLNRYWRQIREQQIEQELRQHYDYTPKQPLPADSMIHHELRRRYFQLDNEILRQVSPQAGSEDALQRARAYLMPFIAEEFNYLETKEFGDIVYSPGDGLYTRTSEGEEYGELWDYAKGAGWQATDKTFIGPNDMKFISAAFMGIAMEKILNPQASGSYTEVLNMAIREAVEYIMVDLNAVIRPSAFHFNHTETPGHILLRQPLVEGKEVDSERLSHMRDSPVYRFNSWSTLRDTCELTTASELYRDQNFPIGYIDKYGPANYRVSGRLLQTQLRHEPVGKRYDGEEDLIISLNAYNNINTAPFIPGYKLVSASPLIDRYGFIADPEGDPYQTCQVIVNQKRRQVLGQIYQDIGLSELANLVMGHSRLTVAELTTLIRMASVYHLPAETKAWDTDDPFIRSSTNISSLKDFRQLVRGDKLHVQCTGAASFLKQSLETVFGPGCASKTDGQVIRPNEKTVNLAGHAQTVFTHKGRQYILDSTPSANLGIQPGSPIPESANYTRPRHAPATPQLSLADHIDNLQPVNRESRLEKTLEEYTDQLIDSLTERLKVAFDLTSDKALHQHLVGLPAHDPARRTLELLLQYQNGRLDLSQIKTIRDYIERCSEASPDLRRKMGFDHYSADLLEQLRSTASHLVWTIENRNNPVTE